MVRTPGITRSEFEMRNLGSEQCLLDDCEVSNAAPHQGDSVTATSDVQSLGGSDQPSLEIKYTTNLERQHRRDQSPFAPRRLTIQDADVSSEIPLDRRDSGRERLDRATCATIISSVRDEEAPPKSRVRPKYKLRPSELCCHVGETIRWWIPEILASLLSLASLIAIITILLVYDRRAVADLSFPTGLTLNAIIAILATVGRAGLGVPVCSGILQEMWLYLSTQSAKGHPESCLNDIELFFRASYGALGSLEYLSKVRPARLMAAQGCLIMVLSLAFGTFVQQCVSYETLAARQSALGNIPRNEYWDMNANDSSQPSPAMLAAIYSAMLGIATPPVDLVCPSGNCSWPATPSLAMCGSCEKKSPTVVNCYNPSQEAAKYCDSGITRYCAPDIYCNYSLANDQYVQLFNVAKYPFDQLSLLSGLDLDSNPVVFSSFTGIREAGEFSRKSRRQQWNGADEGETRADHLHLYLFGLPYGSDLTSLSQPIHWLCKLRACVNNYGASVRSGVQEENIAATDTAQAWVHYLDRTLTYGPVDMGPEIDQQINFTETPNVAEPLTSYLMDLMNGSIHASATNEFSPLTGIWKGTADMDAWIANLAAAVSNVIRTANVTERPEYNGIQYVQTVRVRWYWIVLPALLTFASILFTVLAIIRTANSPVYSWKGSPLTLLLFKVDLTSNDVGSSVFDKHNGVQNTIGKQKVRFVEDMDTVDRRGKWKFVST